MNTDIATKVGWLDSPTEVMAQGPSRPTIIMSAMETKVIKVCSTKAGNARLSIRLRKAGKSSASALEAAFAPSLQTAGS